MKRGCGLKGAMNLPLKGNQGNSSKLLGDCAILLCAIIGYASKPVHATRRTLKVRERDFMARQHNERCKDCKKRVKELIAALYGQVKENFDLDLPCRLEGYSGASIYESLNDIHTALQDHRGFEIFVKAKKLPRVDYFVPSSNLIVEFDESQHFTKPRGIALGLYPDNVKFGFPVQKWRELCHSLNKKDNDPPYRDEQRAWYDTLRDFAPMLTGAGKTVRLYSRDLVWCSLDYTKQVDLQIFERLISSKVAYA